jgi:hypothetical protein
MEVFLLVGWKMSVPAERREGNELMAMWNSIACQMQDIINVDCIL